MIKKITKLSLFALFFACAFSVQAQVLEIDPDHMGETSYRNPHMNLTMLGTAGLLTIPTPDFYDDYKGCISYKGGITKRDMVLGTTMYRTSKNEHYLAANWALRPNLEFSVNHLIYERNCDPYTRGLTYHDEATAFGMKYSTHNGHQDFCFGTAFAPMSAENLDKADFTQIEKLRTVYMTVAEDISKDFHGYLHLKTCFTAVQKIDLGNNQTLRVDRKDFLVSAVGLELNINKKMALILENQFFNYRDIFVQDSVRSSLNGGIRFGMKRFSGEVVGLSLNKDPVTMFGCSAGF